MLNAYEGLTPYCGDLHNHCNVGYGHGSVEDAYRNARTQLDFASVTAHAYWPDIPKQEPRLAAVVAYHEEGFLRAAKSWPHLREVSEAAHQNGQFVTFLSFEWHSTRYGDHNVYFKDLSGEIIRADDLPQMRNALRRLQERGVACFLIPHHIAYANGHRGMSWDDFTPEFSPVVEIFSMHGSSESDDAPYPYLHVMGPRDGKRTMQHGLELGNVFGVIGSTDHHAAHPGSYGHGRAAVWANELTRDSLWEAIAARRTYALTGDRIRLEFSVNGQPMGSILPPTRDREIEVSVVGGGPLDYVEVLYNNGTFHRWSASDHANRPPQDPVKVFLELGWGEKDTTVDWHGQLEVQEGKLLAVEPRFRGRDILMPQSAEESMYSFSSCQRTAEQQVRFTTRTWGNLTTMVPETQGVCLEVQGDARTRIQGRINQHDIQVSLAALGQSSQVGYLGGGGTPAYRIHRAVPKSEYACHIRISHTGEPGKRASYYVRVCQKNGQWAWSSPIWVEASSS